MSFQDKNRRSPTTKDVAEYSGVSTATVSRVVNNKDNVSQATRSKVQAAVNALGYQPNRTAQRLRAKRSLVIGLIISDIQNPFFTSVVRGIEDVAYAQDYSVILCNSDEDIRKEELYADVMRSEGVAGVIIATTSQDASPAQHLLEQGIPVVAMDRSIQDERIDIVSVENVEGAFKAVNHLIALGHQKIGFINLPMNLTTGTERKTGYINALEENHIPVLNQYLCTGDAKQDGGFVCAKRLLESQPELTALFVSNNLMTLGAISAVHKLGLRIPDDISLVGFDDMPWAPFLYPPLTAVAQPTYELGRQSAELLLNRIYNPDKPAIRIQLKTSLILRSSTAPPRTNA